MALDLRPLTLPELLDRAFGLYRRHLWLFIGIMAVPSVFAVAISVLLESMKYATGVGAPAAAGAAPDPTQAAAVAAVFAIGMLVAASVYMIVYTVALGATTLAVSEIYLGRGAAIGMVYRQMSGHAWRLLRLLLITGIRAIGVIFGGMLLTTVVAGVSAALTGTPVLAIAITLVGGAVTLAIAGFMAVRWGVAVPALVLEEHGARASIRRSIELTRGRRWRVLLLVVCATVITYAVMALFQGPFLIGAAMVGAHTSTGFALTLVGTVLGAIATTFTAPIMIIGLALLYYDARIRDEGLDLQLMMTALDATPAGAEPVHG